MAFLNVLLGESPSIARDYAKHYRSSIPHALDYRYDAVKAFDAGSWPTYVLIDPEGTVRLHLVGLSGGQGSADNELRLRRALAEISVETGAAESDGAAAGGVVCKDGVCTLVTEPGRERAVGERSPELAAAPGGGVWMAYVSDRDGDGNIYLRRITAAGEAEDRVVSRSMADDDEPDVAVAADGTVWVVWTSQRSGHYDIYARAWRGQRDEGGGWSPEERLTTSDDDALTPAVAIDGAGRVWVTYTKWNRQFKTSRDRDVFARRRSESGWSPEIRVSPAEPAIEDHTDPAIVADPDNPEAVWVAWSYDYHPSINDKPLDADLPTVFARSVTTSGPISSEPYLVGTKGLNRHAIDLWPSLATDPDGGLWCAYDMAEWAGGRGAVITSFDGEAFAMPERLVGTRGDFCSPRLWIDEGGTRIVVWSQRETGRWRIRATYDAGEGWTEPRVVLAGEGDLRAPDLVGDSEGRFWLACEERDGGGVHVRVEPLEL